MADDVLLPMELVNIALLEFAERLSSSPTYQTQEKRLRAGLMDGASEELAFVDYLNTVRILILKLDDYRNIKSSQESLHKEIYNSQLEQLLEILEKPYESGYKATMIELQQAITRVESMMTVKQQPENNLSENEYKKLARNLKRDDETQAAMLASMKKLSANSVSLHGKVKKEVLQTLETRYYEALKKLDLAKIHPEILRGFHVAGYSDPEHYTRVLQSALRMFVKLDEYAKTSLGANAAIADSNKEQLKHAHDENFKSHLAYAIQLIDHDPFQIDPVTKRLESLIDYKKDPGSVLKYRQVARQAEQIPQMSKLKAFAAKVAATLSYLIAVGGVVLGLTLLAAGVGALSVAPPAGVAMCGVGIAVMLGSLLPAKVGLLFEDVAQKYGNKSVDVRTSLKLFKPQGESQEQLHPTADT
jgi:hypothetical protein